MGRLWFALVVAVLALVATAPAQAKEFTKQDVQIVVSDGVAVHGSLYVPAGDPPAAGWPAIVLFHGLGGSHTDMNKIAEATFAPQDYVVLTVDARAHGETGGLFSLVGTREMQDVREEFAWLAARPVVDEAHIGVWGISLGGGTALRSAVEGVPWAAVETAETWSDLYSALVPQNLSKSGVVYQFSTLVPRERYDPFALSLLPALLNSTNLGAVKSYFDERSSLSRLATLRTPTLLMQGRKDFAFDIAQATRAYAQLGGPKRLYIGAFGHPPSTFPGPDANHVFLLGLRWFDHFLKGVPNGVDTEQKVELATAPFNGTVVGFQALPRTKTLAFSFGGASSIGALGKAVRTTKRLPSRVEQFGSATIRFRASSRTSWPHAVVVLSALRPDGTEDVLTEGGAATTISRTPRTITVRTMADANLIPAGSRLRVTIAGASTAQNPNNLLYLVGVRSGSTLKIDRVRLTLPVLRNPISR